MFFGKSKRAEELKGQVEALCLKADEASAAGRPTDAAKLYAESWQLLAGTRGGVKTVGEEYAFWL